MSTATHRASAADLSLPHAHLNLRWSLADIDQLEAMLQRRRPLSDIAARFDVEPSEIMKMVARNPFMPRPRI